MCSIISHQHICAFRLKEHDHLPSPTSIWHWNIAELATLDHLSAGRVLNKRVSFAWAN